MMRAHQGQALDLGHDMIHTSQADVLEISVAAIELKTGELMAMCAELGAIVGGADAATRGCLAKFGLRFGVALQMFNDIGEVSQRNESINAHRPLQRPSWVWAVAARELEPADFSRFQRLASQATASADEDELLLRHVLAKANELAHAEFKTCMDEINDLVETDAHKATRLLLQELAQKVMRAYA
jgi:geranylgeranyl pyrophosphate synthase